MKFKGKKQLVEKLQKYLKNYDSCEIWGSFLKKQYFANNFLIKVLIWEFFFTHVTQIIGIILRTAKFVSTKLILVKYKFTFLILHFNSKITLHYLKTPVAFSLQNYRLK